MAARLSRDRRENGRSPPSILVHEVCLYGCERARTEGRQVDATRIFSRQDLEAHEALRNYRRSIGLDPELPRVSSPALSRMGEWIDGLAPWQLFITATFRPVRRRWGNPRGFAAVENIVKDARQVSGFRTLRSTDFGSNLASRSPSIEYVKGFFERFIHSLETDLSCRLSYFVGFEAGRISGANHFHALLSTACVDAPFEFWRRGLWQTLYRNAGRALILPFEKDRGAGWYLAAAYVGKRPLGWDVHIHGRTHLTRRPKPGGHALPVAPSALCARDYFHLSLPRWHR
jgi:hypothetical protein